MNRSSKIKIATFSAALLVGGSSLEASTLEERLGAVEKELATLKEQNQVLTEELTSMENEKWYASVDVTKSQSGMGAAASKVYYSENPLSIGGYGEVYFSNPSNNDAFTDVYRFIPYIGYKFSDNIVLNTEIEFEHGGEEVAIEFLYLDFLINQYANIRVGQQLVPMGLINLRHEPTLFPTVLRPETETYVIPSTWNELGVSVYGSTDYVEYQAGIINALNLNSLETQTSDKKWIKNARRGSKEKIAAKKAAFVGRADYVGIDGLKTGASVYYGNGSNTDTPLPQVGESDLSMFIYEIHAAYKKNGLFANALWTQASLNGADKIPGTNVAKKAQGGYANIGYNFFRHLPENSLNMPIFYQYEKYNPVKEVANGTSTYSDISSHTVGVNYFPHEQVVLKAEYQIKDDKNVQDEKIKTVSLSFGFIF